MTVLEQSPFFDPALRAAWAQFDPKLANQLLDEAGLTERDGYGIRRLPDGRPMELVVETAGERQEVENALQIITDDWRDVGVKLIMRPLDRDILRNRVFSGHGRASRCRDDGLQGAERGWHHADDLQPVSQFPQPAAADPGPESLAAAALAAALPNARLGA